MRITVRLFALIALPAALAFPAWAQTDGSPSPTPTPAREKAGEDLATPVPDVPADLQVPDFSFGPSGSSTSAETFDPTTSRPAARATNEARGIVALSTTRGFQNVAQVDELVSTVASAELNRVYAEVRTIFGATYPSSWEAPAPFTSVAFPDPAGTLRERLTGKGDLYALVDLLPAHSALAGSKPSATSLLGKNPSFACKSLSGDMTAEDNLTYLDPGNPEVIRYLVNVVRDIDEKLFPAGYLFRGAGFPGQEWGYGRESVDAFRAAVGGAGNPAPNDPTWGAWRRERMSYLLSMLKDAVKSRRKAAKISVLVEIDQPAPSTWEEYLSSRPYADRMQDWIGWCREGLVDEIVFSLNDRTNSPAFLPGWVTFINTNCGSASPLVLLRGDRNYTANLIVQYKAARERGVGTLLYHYQQPARDVSRGFFSSLPNIVFRQAPGRPLKGRRISGDLESRQFAIMNPPPPAMSTPTPAIPVFVNPLENKELVFTTPTPIPTPEPEARYVPASIPRKVTLTSGKVINAIVLELTPTMITIQAEGSRPVAIARDKVESIEPPL